VTSLDVTTQRPFSNDRDSSFGAEAVTAHKTGADPMQGRLRALRLIEVSEAEEGIQGEWLGGLFDFIAKRGERPDVHELGRLKASAIQARRTISSNAAVLESCRRRDKALFNEIMEAHGEQRGERLGTQKTQ
jgi:hypothetical protein